MTYKQHVAGAQGICARCAIITLSDTRTLETDTSGQTIRQLLEADGHRVESHDVIRDEPTALSALLSEHLDEIEIDVIITNGGTGISRRDQTIEVITQLNEQPLPGFGELFRMLSWEQIGSGAMLSRAVAGIARGKPIFALPGSTPAVTLAMRRLILPELQHILRELKK